MLTKKSVLFTSLFLSSLTVSANSDHHLFDSPIEDITIECFDECNATALAKEYILRRANFALATQKITVEKAGEVMYTTTIYEFLKQENENNKQFSFVNKSKSSKSYKSQGVSSRDAPLSCNYDIDFSCSQWNEDRDLSLLANYLENYTFEITLNQDMVDNVNYSTAAIAALLAATPTAKFGQLLNVYTKAIIAEKIQKKITTLAGFALGVEIQEVLSQMILNGAKVGDVLTFKNGRIVSIKRVGSDSGSTGSGSGSGSDNINSGQTLGHIFSNLNNLNLVCSIVYTKSGNGSYTPQEVCFID